MDQSAPGQSEGTENSASGQMSRADPYRELIRLLNRALRSVPRVKLDKVEEITRLFQRALDVLEANCDLTPEERAEIQKERQSIEEAYTATAMTGPPLPANLEIPSSSEEEEEEEEEEESSEEEEETKEMPLGKVTVSTISDSIPFAREFTRDYSSPKGSTRTLAGTKGISSRATTGSRPGSDVEDQAEEPPAASRKHRRGRERERSERRREEDEEDVAQSPVRYTSDYSSPRGQTRSLGPAKTRSSRASSTSSVSSKAEGESTSVAAEEEEPLAQPQRRLSASRLTAKESRPEKKELLETAKEKELDGDEEEPLSASPKLVHASRRLVQLATPTSETRRLGDSSAASSDHEEVGPDLLTAPPQQLPQLLMPQPQLQPQPQPQLQLQPEPQPQLEPQPQAESQAQKTAAKPAYLRRLDSPDSHSGKLLAARNRLSGLIQLALKVAPKLKPEACQATLVYFVEATKALEAGTVSP